jgi:ectoine hydroxylase-related dioxygenase (phytanoyl-CoA dioxygenase family)
MRDERIRTDRDKFFDERWRTHQEGGDGKSLNNAKDVSQEDKDCITNTLCRTLPLALNRLLIKKGELYLFNEHYVVKPPQSNITFRWHRDADEQLQFCYDQNIEYYSLWCPLDDVDEYNGTLQVPAGTAIQTLDAANEESSVLKGKIAELFSPDLEYLQPPSDIIHDGDDSLSTHPTYCTPAPPLSISVSRGSGVVFSSLMWHCSGANLSNTPRRVIYAQYSNDIITNTGGNSVNCKRKRNEDSETCLESHSSPLCFAIPCDTIEMQA